MTDIASMPDPFPDYVTCPHCGEPEVEFWCYQVRVRCHACGGWITRAEPLCSAVRPHCTLWKELVEMERESGQAPA